jgi:micrococcal nuclease
VSGGINLKPERPSRTFLNELVLGKTVRVEYDALHTAGERRAYVFLQDGTLVNAEMLRQGQARVDLSRPFAHEQEFKRLEAQARAAGMGIWVNRR